MAEVEARPAPAPRPLMSARARRAWHTRRERARQLELFQVPTAPELTQARAGLLELLRQRPPLPDNYGRPFEVCPGHWSAARLICERAGRLRLRFELDPNTPPLNVAGPRLRKEGARYLAADLLLVTPKGCAPYWRASGVIEVCS